MIEEGQITAVKAGRYFVKTGGEIRECSAKGVLRIKSEGIYTGDFVEIENNVVKRVLPRKSRLLRPNVANVDIAVVVISYLPEPDFYLTDKFISHCYLSGVPCIIVVNKTDADKNILSVVEENYKLSAERIFAVSANTGAGLKDFTQYITGKLAVFSGQSAVGKTSIVNALFGEDRQTGELSAKTNRGKQTTTSSEIIEKDGLTVIDTPGFSSLDLNLSRSELPDAYPEFAGYSGNCRFKDCRHMNEPDCAVIQAAKDGEISLGRYNRYREIYASAKDKTYEKRN